jgi:hypothetical protein
MRPKSRAVQNGDFRKAKSILSLRFVVRGRKIELAILKEARDMAIESHLAELEKRHEALEEQISEALAHPSTDDLQLLELKRKKLHVKDEIMRLRQDVLVH